MAIPGLNLRLHLNLGAPTKITTDIFTAPFRMHMMRIIAYFKLKSLPIISVWWGWAVVDGCFYNDISCGHSYDTGQAFMCYAGATLMSYQVTVIYGKHACLLERGNVYALSLCISHGPVAGIINELGTDSASVKRRRSEDYCVVHPC